MIEARLELGAHNLLNDRIEQTICSDRRVCIELLRELQ
jgi:hypothetical protein